MPHFVGLMLMMLVLAAVPVGAQDRCGDADGSGAVSVTDGVQTLRAAASLPSTCTLARCDVNDDGAVSVTDGVNVLREAAGLAPTLTCPGAAPACQSATATVTLAVPAPIGAAELTLSYPASSVTLPGTGDVAPERVTFANPGAVLFGGQPNDLDDRVRFGLVAGESLDDGVLLSVRFDCLGPAPGAAAFACRLDDVRAPDGVTPITGATCMVQVASE